MQNLDRLKWAVILSSLAMGMAAWADGAAPAAGVGPSGASPQALRPEPPLVDEVYGELSERELTPALRTLSKHVGVYRLDANSASDECYGLEPLKSGDTFALELRKARAKSEFARKGDVTMFLRRYYPQWTAEGEAEGSPVLGRWYRTFDRADFFGIGRWSMPRFALLTMISGGSKYDAKNGVLSQTTKMTALTGSSETSVQSIRFNDADSSFSYSYTITDRNILGKVGGTMKAGECIFKKVSDLPSQVAVGRETIDADRADAGARRGQTPPQAAAGPASPSPVKAAQ